MANTQCPLMTTALMPFTSRLWPKAEITFPAFQDLFPDKVPPLGLFQCRQQLSSKPHGERRILIFRLLVVPI